jgi:von Willebrand factor type A domain/Aerotolerance regulator N-terminal
MNFATPFALSLVALAVPIVVFYILKVRLRRLPVSTNLFWKQLFDEKPPRSIWQALRHLLSLLAQLFFVLLLVLAIADPSFSWQLLKARRIVTVIDNSASMRAADVLPSRFEAAIEAALTAADGLRFRDEMAIVLAGPEPEVVVGMSGHIPTLKRALRSIHVSDNPTKIQPAIELGRQLVGDHPHGKVLVFTDGCEESGERRVESEEAVSHVQRRIFGTEDAGNIGITQFQVRRSLIDPLGYEVLIRVRNASAHLAKGRLELELDGAPVDVLPLELQPDGVFTRSLEKTSLEGGTLVVRLTEFASDNNSLATDDTAWAILPPREIQEVLIVTPGNLFLQKAFEANPLVRVTVRNEFPEIWPTDGIIVLHRQVPEQLPAGDLFIVDPQNDCDAWAVGESLANPIITEQDKDSPLMTHVRLDNVLVPEARKLRFTETPHVLAGSLSGDPVYAEVKRTNGKSLILSVNIDEGDLTFRTAFPIMVTNSLGWFAGQAGELRPSLATGVISEIELTNANIETDDLLQLRSPSGDLRSLGVKHQGTIGIPPLDECGVWTVTHVDQSLRGRQRVSGRLAYVAANLSDESESDLRTPVELLSKDKPKTLIAGWVTRPIWFYLAALACLLTVGEWWLYQRRMIT